MDSIAAGFQVFSRFIQSRSGNFGIMAAVTSIPLILAAGVAVDYTRYLSATKHLQEVADAGALAVAAATEKDEEKLRKRADEVVQGNYSDSRIDTLQVASLELRDDQVDLPAFRAERMGWISAPIISRAIEAADSLRGSQVPTTRPPRRIVALSHSARISSSLWLI